MTGAFEHELLAGVRQPRERGYHRRSLYVSHGEYAVSGAQPVEVQ